MTALQLVHREPRVGPGDGLAIARAGGLDRRVHHLDRAVEVALEPAQVRRAGVGLVERLEVDHLLIGLGRLRHAALLHQHVAEEAEVEHELTRRHQPPRDRLRLAEAVHLVQHVTAEQQRGRFVRRDRLETRGRLLGHLVEARVVREACPGDEAVSKMFGGARRGALLAQVLLQRRDVAVVAGVGGNRDEAGAIEALGVLIEGWFDCRHAARRQDQRDRQRTR